MDFVHAIDRHHVRQSLDGLPAFDEQDDQGAAVHQANERGGIVRRRDHRQHEHRRPGGQHRLHFAGAPVVQWIDPRKEASTVQHRPHGGQIVDRVREIQVRLPRCRSAFPSRSRSTPMR